MEIDWNERKGGISIDSACLVARAFGLEVSEVFPNTELSYNYQGRPAQSSGTTPNTKKSKRKHLTCPECGMEVSLVHESGRSECCGAKVAT
jgi:hypothetical protein